MVSTGLSKSLSLGSNPSGSTMYMLERIKRLLEDYPDEVRNPYILIGRCFTELELETFTDRELDIILKLASFAIGELVK